MRKSLLLVVDVQNYFFEKSSKSYIRGAENLAQKINRVIKIFEENKSPIIFLQFIPSKRKINFNKWWKHLPYGNDLELYEKIYLPKNYYIVRKNSYSVFQKKSFKKLLKLLKIKQIFFVGVMTELCVESNVRESFENGFENYVVEDLVKSRKLKHHRYSIENMKRGFAKIINSRDIFDGKI
ncbi:MAG: isochorismatase family cysteine hydrolase [candidate division WOR-3 bacterium]